MNNDDLSLPPLVPPPVHDPQPVSYQEIEAKTITRKAGTTDPWFVSRYGMNLYRGCEHGCVYCDGRAEKYYVTGDFSHQIAVKRNAVAVLATELSRIREPGFIFVGGGVSDAYQPAEARYQLARGALQLAHQHRLPVHLLTKSSLVKRDLDLLQEINTQTRAILSFSIHTTEEPVRELFEPGAAPLAQRWALLAEAKQRGLGTGVMAMPVLPGISDPPEAIDALVAQAATVGVDFICFSGLTLRPGIQKDGYLQVIAAHYPQHLAGYQRLYLTARPSGAGAHRYYARLEHRFFQALRHYQLPGRVPRHLFHGLIPLYTEAAVLLEHHQFQCALEGRVGPEIQRLGQAGYAIQRWAKGCFGKRRSKGFTWQVLEVEFKERVADRSILALEGMTPAALPIIEETLALADADHQA